MSGDYLQLGDDWSLWTTAVLRGAGFPAELALELAAPATSEAADRLIAGRDRLAEVRDRAVVALRGVPRSRPVNKAIRALERGALPAASDRLGDATGAVDAVIAAATEVDALEARLVEVAAAEGIETARRLKKIAADPWFREALMWQNRAAVHKSVASYLRRPPGKTDAKTRQQERLLAAYLQRYTVKNDTIGFFGPVGWARVGAPRTRIVAGDDRLASRSVFFERWAIDALAATLSTDPALLVRAAPRALPTLAITEGAVGLPDGKSIAVSEQVAGLLARCDGQTPATELAAGDDEVLALLEALAERGLIVWEIDVPSEVDDPAAELRRWLTEAGPAGRDGIDALDRLERGRRAVAAAAGDPTALDRALGDLDQIFEAITGQRASRRPGEIHAGRQLVYEDAVRDATVEIGADTVDALAPALRLVLDSVRWFSHTIAERYRTLLIAEFEALAGAERTVDYLRFWRRVEPHFAASQSQPPPIVDEVAAELAGRWAALLELDASRSPAVIERSAASLAERAAELFAAPGPGWPGAIHVSPDLMFATDAPPGAATLAVLGEIHLDCTALARCLVQQHPDPDALLRRRQTDIDRPRIAPVQARQFESRTDALSRSPRDYHVEIGRSRSWRPQSQVLRAGDLIVERDGATLRVRDEVRAVTFEMIDFLEQYLRFSASSHVRLVGPATYVPRIVIDQLVISRRQWSATDAELPALDGNRLANLVALRTWARDRGLPRWVFAKVPTEPKPVFLDFDSPIAVEILANLARSAPEIRLVEMLPGFGQLWLTDRDDRRFTCELRLTGVDHRRP